MLIRIEGVIFSLWDNPAREGRPIGWVDAPHDAPVSVDLLARTSDVVLLLLEDGRVAWASSWTLELRCEESEWDVIPMR